MDVGSKASLPIRRMDAPGQAHKPPAGEAPEVDVLPPEPPRVDALRQMLAGQQGALRDIIADYLGYAHDPGYGGDRTAWAGHALADAPAGPSGLSGQVEWDGHTRSEVGNRLHVRDRKTGQALADGVSLGSRHEWYSGVRETLHRMAVRGPSGPDSGGPMKHFKPQHDGETWIGWVGANSEIQLGVDTQSRMAFRVLAPAEIRQARKERRRLWELEDGKTFIDPLDNEDRRGGLRGTRSPLGEPLPRLAPVSRVYPAVIQAPGAGCWQRLRVAFGAQPAMRRLDVALLFGRRVDVLGVKLPAQVQLHAGHALLHGCLMCWAAVPVLALSAYRRKDADVSDRHLYGYAIPPALLVAWDRR